MKASKLLIAHSDMAAPRMRALIDGEVRVDGYELDFYRLASGEMLFRAFNDPIFHAAELSLSNYVTRAEEGTCNFIALPIYNYRSFKHGDIYIRTDAGIKTPRDLKGRRVAIHGYRHTSYVWVRGILQDEYGLNPSDIRWISALHNRPEAHEEDTFVPPPGLMIESIKGKDVSDLLEARVIDATIGAHPPACFTRGAVNISRLFPDYESVEDDYYVRTRSFPILHVVGLRKELHRADPSLARRLFEAFSTSNNMALAALRTPGKKADADASPIAEADRMTALMGPDYYRFGLGDEERETLKKFLRYHFDQGLSKRHFEIEDLFAHDFI